MKDTLAVKKSTPAVKTAAKEPKKPRKITESYLENAGKFYLEKFPASIRHFRMIMTRKIRKSCQHHPDQDLAQCQTLLDNVVEKFVRLGFLNDEALTKGLLYSYKQRGWSQRKIKATLITKGLAGDLVEEGMADHDSGSEINAAVRCVRRKRLGAFATGEAKPEKWLAALGRAGFDYETARKALSMSKDEIEDILRNLD
jgi:regulatory protein